jgi:hypothetical protein
VIEVDVEAVVDVDPDGSGTGVESIVMTNGFASQTWSAGWRDEDEDEDPACGKVGVDVEADVDVDTDGSGSGVVESIIMTNGFASKVRSTR